MKKLLTLFVCGWCVLWAVYGGEGILRGKITDENGEPLIGATIVIKTQPTVGTLTDYDGKYSIKIPPDSPHTISISFIGYQLVEEAVTIRNNEVIVKDFTLLPEAKTLEDVVVTAKARKANDSYMQLIKNKSAVSLDYISAETIKRTGDSHATDAIKRITGVSTIGGFVSVRGLADRYIKTALNGLRIPTLDPISNNIKLDIFPTSLIDNIVITKTASPDLPGDWAGSYVSIETKDYPDKLSVNMSTTIGYNEQTTFREIVSSKRSETDWLGYDNGFRDLYRTGYNGSYPVFFGDSRPISPYNEFSAFGLQPYMDSLGISSGNLGYDSQINMDYYYRICLVQLGLLSPGQIDDPEAVSAAAEQFDIQYKDSAFVLLNTPVTEFGQKMPNNWGTVTRRAPLNFSQEISVGNQFSLFKRPLGFLVGIRYSSSVRYDPNASANIARVPENEGSTNYITVSAMNKSAAETNGWSALVNLAYAFSPNHSISLMFMPNLNGVNYVREGLRRNYDLAYMDSLVYVITQYYEERKQLVYQFHSINYFPGPKLKVDISASFTDGSSSVPDSKSLKLYPDGGQYIYRASDYEYKKSTYLLEDVFDARLSAELPISNLPGLIRKVKFGAAYQKNNREGEIYQFYLSDYGAKSDIIINNLSEINEVFSKENFGIHNNSFFYYNYSPNPINFVLGYSIIQAGYLMVDYAINPALRLSGGLRLEHTDIFTDVRLYYELKLPDNHPDRLGASQGLFQLPSARPGVLKRYNYLPSLNIVYKVFSSEATTINARFNFSQTIARPSIREISNLYQQDFILQKDIMGNPRLKIVDIDNYDLRFESFFANGDDVSASLFYKKFRNHIEMVDKPYTTWENADIAEAYGIELEGQKRLTKNFDFRANVTLIKSFAKIKLEQYTLTHPMFGQAPYIINAILGYTSERSGLSAALSYNVQGRKLALVNIRATNIENSDIYEMPQHLLDFKLSKTLGKHFNLSLRIRNILNSPVRRAYDFSKAGLIDYDCYTYGTDYLLGISYSL